MKSAAVAASPAPTDTIAPVTIFDAEGRVVRVVPAAEFRASGPPSPGASYLRVRRAHGASTGQPATTPRPLPPARARG